MLNVNVSIVHREYYHIINLRSQVTDDAVIKVVIYIIN